LQIGAMTNPRRRVEEEIRWIGENRFDFVDLAIEAPQAEPEQLDVLAIRQLLEDFGLGVVAHAAPYLPVSSPSARVRQAARDELVRYLDVAAEVGASLLTTHFVGWPDWMAEGMAVELYGQLYDALCREAQKRGIAVAMENGPGYAGQLKALRRIFRRASNLQLLLDIGHANIHVAKNQTQEYLLALADRLAHVHMSDNDGTDDDHLPLGASRKGGVNWEREVEALRSFDYDGTITLEVFGDRRYLLASREYLRALWK